MTSTCRVAEAAITEVIESVFATVDQVRGDVASCYHQSLAESGCLTDGALRSLAPGLRDRLRATDTIAAGLGFIAEPGLVPGRPLRLEWWQWLDGHRDPVALEVDLRPTSLDFYDYARTDWFAVPRETSRRHLCGPYVDVHDTDLYLLTLTVPVHAGDRFLGVAGADLPVDRFAAVLLPRLGEADEVVLVNGEGRVVLSTTSRWWTGSRVPAADRRGAHRLPEASWSLL